MKTRPFSRKTHGRDCRAHAVIIRSATTITDEIMSKGENLVVIGRAGIGLDNVDVESATKRGIMVVNAPKSNILSAAEHTLALLLSQARIFHLQMKH